MAYAAPSTNDTALIGRNTRSGLKIVTIFRMMRKNFVPSRASLIFDAPTRARASQAYYHASLGAALVIAVVLHRLWVRAGRPRGVSEVEALAEVEPVEPQGAA